MNTTASNVSSAADTKPTLRDLLSIFFFYKRTFIMTFLGVVLGALILVLISPEVYKTSARIVVKPPIDKPAIFQADTSRLSTSDRVDQTTINTVVHLITSADVLRNVVLKLGLANPNDEVDILEQIDMLAGRISVEPLSMSNLVEVTMKGGVPVAVRDTLNVLLDEYIAYHILVNQSLEGQMEFFDQQARVFHSKYEQLGQELADMHRRFNLVNPDIQSDNQLKVVRDLEAARFKVISRLDRMSQHQANLEQILTRSQMHEALASLPAELRDAYPALVQMEKSLAQLIINLQRAQSDFLPGTKPAKDAESQYDNMRRQIRNYISSAINAIRLEQDSAQLELRQLQQKIKEGKDNLGDLSADALLLGQIDFEYRMAEENYKLYEAKREEARINREKDRSNFANVSIASRPVLPVHPWFPKRALIMMIAMVLGFLLAVAATLAAYFMDYTVRTPTDIALRSRIRLLGTLDAI